MDVGEALWCAITTAGTVGFAAHCWRTRRRPAPVVLPARSHVRKVVPGVGSCGDAERGCVAVPPAPGTRSLAVDAWASLAGGTELEAKIETARRHVSSHPVFGDRALLRRRPADPAVAAAVKSLQRNDPAVTASVEAYYSHPRHGGGL